MRKLLAVFFIVVSLPVMGGVGSTAQAGRTTAGGAPCTPTNCNSSWCIPDPGEPIQKCWSTDAGLGLLGFAGVLFVIRKSRVR